MLVCNYNFIFYYYFRIISTGLDAANNVVINQNILDGTPGGDSLNLTLTAGGSVGINAAIQTNGGNVTISIAGDLRLNLDAESSGGRVKTDIPVSVMGTVKQAEMKGTINGGGPLLTLKTSGGSVHIERP